MTEKGVILITHEGNKLYMNVNEVEYYNNWLEFNSKLLFMVGFKATPEQIKKAEEILFQDEKYRKFKT